MSAVNPRKIFKIDGGLKAGKKADISIVDMNAEWTVDRTKFYSKSKNIDEIISSTPITK